MLLFLPVLLLSTQEVAPHAGCYLLLSWPLVLSSTAEAAGAEKARVAAATAGTRAQRDCPFF